MKTTLEQLLKEAVIHVWELYRKQHVKHGLKKSAFFDAETSEQVYER